MKEVMDDRIDTVFQTEEIIYMCSHLVHFWYWASIVKAASVDDRSLRLHEWRAAQLEKRAKLEKMESSPSGQRDHRLTTGRTRGHRRRAVALGGAGCSGWQEPPEPTGGTH